MKFNINYWRTEQYIPTKRHRKLRQRAVQDTMEITVPELSEADFPVAFIVHNYKYVYENARTYHDFDGTGDYRSFAEEIRTYQGNLYSAVHVTYGAAVSMCYEPLSYIKDMVEKSEQKPWYLAETKDFTDRSIIKETNDGAIRSRIREGAEKYVVYDGKVWQKCREPMYVITTFGLGHNHGGTGFFVEDTYNPNISKNNYFTALQREEAIAYGKKIAANRGDTKSIDTIGKRCSIDVLMPEMVRRNPQKEHGDGDPWMNRLQSLCSVSDSAMEAGCLVLAALGAEMRKEA